MKKILQTTKIKKQIVTPEQHLHTVDVKNDEEEDHHEQQK